MPPGRWEAPGLPPAQPPAWLHSLREGRCCGLASYAGLSPGWHPLLRRRLCGQLCVMSSVREFRPRGRRHRGLAGLAGWSLGCAGRGPGCAEHAGFAGLAGLAGLAGFARLRGVARATRGRAGRQRGGQRGGRAGQDATAGRGRWRCARRHYREGGHGAAHRTAGAR
eukprot:scaffold52636_cov61-Phaeocystis_antarctica.AAC.2